MEVKRISLLRCPSWGRRALGRLLSEMDGRVGGQEVVWGFWLDGVWVELWVDECRMFGAFELDWSADFRIFLFSASVMGSEC